MTDLSYFESPTLMAKDVSDAVEEAMEAAAAGDADLAACRARTAQFKAAAMAQAAAEYAVHAAAAMEVAAKAWAAACAVNDRK